MPMQNSINAHPDCRMLCTCTRSWSEPSREVWNVSYDGICVDCARKGPLLISPSFIFSHPCDSHSAPPPKFICFAHSNRLRLSSPSSSRSPSSLRSFSPGPEVSLVMARSIWSFVPVVHCTFYIYSFAALCQVLFPHTFVHFCPHALLSIPSSLRKGHRRLQPVVPCSHVNLVLISNPACSPYGHAH